MKLLRFADLRARGIVTSWPMLRYRVAHNDFPPGIMLGANTRAWYEEDIEAWVASRPTDRTQARAAPWFARTAPLAQGHRQHRGFRYLTTSTRTA
jgi:hypothetical protein